MKLGIRAFPSHASSVRTTASESPVSRVEAFQTTRSGVFGPHGQGVSSPPSVTVLRSALKRAYLVSPGENTESEGHAVRVVGVVIVGVAVVVDIAEVVGVTGIRRTLPPPVRNRTTIQDLTRAGF